MFDSSSSTLSGSVATSPTGVAKKASGGDKDLATNSNTVIERLRSANRALQAEVDNLRENLFQPVSFRLNKKDLNRN